MFIVIVLGYWFGYDCGYKSYKIARIDVSFDGMTYICIAVVVTSDFRLFGHVLES